VTVDFSGPAGPIYDALLSNGIIVWPLAGYGTPVLLPIALRCDSGADPATEVNSRALRVVKRVVH